MQRDIVPVILAGGEGRRLRPLTGPDKPKPFLRTFSDYSLLQLTLMRSRNFQAPVIVCDQRFVYAAIDDAQQINIYPEIIAEPAQRGTAAAIVSAAFMLQRDNPLMLVMPSDHLVEDYSVFNETVRQAAELVPEDAPLIIGRKPDGGHDRYGYIRTQEGVAGTFVLESFIEKPSPRVARKLAKTEGVFWNTGIFLCRAQILLALCAEHAPDIFEMAGQAMAASKRTANVLVPDVRRYAHVPSLSIDHAIMEHLEGGVVLPLETGWHDVGCWEKVFALKLKSMTGSLLSPRHEPGRSKQFVK